MTPRGSNDKETFVNMKQNLKIARPDILVILQIAMICS